MHWAKLYIHPRIFSEYLFLNLYFPGRGRCLLLILPAAQSRNATISQTDAINIMPLKNIEQ
jgi:hypothetical protein